jgi:hypothetical protein
MAHSKTRKNRNKYTALIIEPRKHKALEFVLKNFLENLSNEWSIIIFHGNLNKNPKSFGIHGVWKYHSMEKLKSMYPNIDKLASLQGVEE